MSDKLSDNISEKMSNYNVCQIECQNICYKHIPDKVSARMSDYLSDRMSSYSQIECQICQIQYNANKVPIEFQLVGITRCPIKFARPQLQLPSSLHIPHFRPASVSNTSLSIGVGYACSSCLCCSIDRKRLDFLVSEQGK